MCRGENKTMETIRIINFIITAIFAVCYSYQFLYVPVSLWFQGRDKRHMKNAKAEADNELCERHLKRYAVLISARNEENVIGQLIDSINSQTYKGEILMFDNSRDAMAIAMQQCGIDPSSCTKADVDKAVVKLKEQKPLLKKYAMDQVFDEMLGSQAAIASYYAGDIAVMMEENEDLDYCLPASGSNLFYDAFCVPTCSKNKDNAEAFINYMQEPEIAAENCKYLRYGTPNTGASDFLDDDIKNSELTFPGEDYLNKCYIFKNVDDDVYAYMQEQFLKVKAS